MDWYGGTLSQTRGLRPATICTKNKPVVCFGGFGDGNKTSQGGLSEAGSDGGESEGFWVGVMITENKKATVVRPHPRPASNYTHRHTHIHGGFQSGHQAVAEVSHGHHVCWPMASRLINKQSGMEGQIRDRCGGGAEKRGVGGGGNWRGHSPMMIAK